MTELTPTEFADAYSDICDLFERFAAGCFDPSPDCEEWPIPAAGPQARMFANRVLEILRVEDVSPPPDPDTLRAMADYLERCSR